MLEPKICGLWDGCGLWLQWEGVPEAAYELQIRYRREEADPWGEWIHTVPPQGERSHWGVIPTWKEGWMAQARVKMEDSGNLSDDAFEIAREVTFAQCTALFEISSERYDQHFVAGTIFHAQVDGAACAYQAHEAIHIRAGEKARVRLIATGSSGYFQLDHPDHFDVKPTFGVRVRNVEASVEDIAETGRDWTVIAPKPQPDMVTMAVAAKTEF
jgi:hypothetical protein